MTSWLYPFVLVSASKACTMHFSLLYRIIWLSHAMFTTSSELGPYRLSRRLLRRRVSTSPNIWLHYATCRVSSKTMSHCLDNQWNHIIHVRRCTRQIRWKSRYSKLKFNWEHIWFSLDGNLRETFWGGGGKEREREGRRRRRRERRCSIWGKSMSLSSKSNNLEIHGK